MVAAHGLGGTVGALLTGVLAQKAWGAPANGLLFGNPKQLAVQAAAVLAAILWSAGATWGLLKLIALLSPLRAAGREEGLGMDVSQHGEKEDAHEAGGGDRASREAPRGAGGRCSVPRCAASRSATCRATAARPSAWRPAASRSCSGRRPRYTRNTLDIGAVTQALARLRAGQREALPELVHLLYHDLHEIARRELRRERRGHTLGPTALVNEAYLRLSRDAHLDPRSRTQFLAAACVSMRRVLVDYARARKRLKRGGGETPEPLDEQTAADLMSEREADEILALEGALNRLEAADQRAARVVQLRFFGGLTMEQIAQLMDVSSKTVQRTWLAARAWLRKEIGQELA